MAPPAATCPASDFTAIVKEIHRLHAILEFMFDKQPSSNAMSGYSDLTARDLHPHARSQASINFKTTAMIPNNLILQTFPDKIWFNNINMKFDKHLKHVAPTQTQIPHSNKYVDKASGVQEAPSLQEPETKI